MEEAGEDSFDDIEESDQFEETHYRAGKTSYTIYLIRQIAFDTEFWKSELGKENGLKLTILSMNFD